jgi:hypothetical protein
LKRKRLISFDNAAPENAANSRQTSAKPGALGKENTMTRRILRIAMILVIIQSLLFLPAPVSRAQDGPTQAELVIAQQTADLFVKRLEETGDFSTVIDEMYVEDFIERYIQQQILESKDSDSDIYFPLWVCYKRGLLKQATVEDWRRLYIASNNFTYQFMVAGLNKYAEDILNDRDVEDDEIGKLIPPNVIELFKNHPTLKGVTEIINDKADKPEDGEPEGESHNNSAQEEGEPKPIETLEEMQDATKTLQEAVRLWREEQDNLSPGLTESAKSALEVNRLKLKDEGMEPGIKVLERKYMGLPVGTRLLFVPTPFMFCLDIAEVNGKPKIVTAHLAIRD